MDSLKFNFRAYESDGKTIVHIIMDGVEAVFKYSDPEKISFLVENLHQMLDYAIEDYMLKSKFKDQIENELDDWLRDVNDS